MKTKELNLLNIVMQEIFTVTVLVNFGTNKGSSGNNTTDIAKTGFQCYLCDVRVHLAWVLYPEVFSD